MQEIKTKLFCVKVVADIVEWKLRLPTECYTTRFFVHFANRGSVSEYFLVCGSHFSGLDCLLKYFSYLCVIQKPLELTTRGTLEGEDREKEYKVS